MRPWAFRGSSWAGSSQHMWKLWVKLPCLLISLVSRRQKWLQPRQTIWEAQPEAASKSTASKHSSSNKIGPSSTTFKTRSRVWRFKSRSLRGLRSTEKTSCTMPPWETTSRLTRSTYKSQQLVKSINTSVLFITNKTVSTRDKSQVISLPQATAALSQLYLSRGYMKIKSRITMLPKLQLQTVKTQIIKLSGNKLRARNIWIIRSVMVRVLRRGSDKLKSSKLCDSLQKFAPQLSTQAAPNAFQMWDSKWPRSMTQPRRIVLSLANLWLP